MKVLVVYESMFANTHAVAESIADGVSDSLGEGHEVSAVPVESATPEALEGTELLVVGGPTHMHGMSSNRSRSAAVDMAEDPEKDLELDPDAEGEGLRDWFHELPKKMQARAAAFDTRLTSVAPVMSGRASKGISRRLRHHGLELVAEPESFGIDDENHLVEGEQVRARDWGASLAAATGGRG